MYFRIENCRIGPKTYATTVVARQDKRLRGGQDKDKRRARRRQEKGKRRRGGGQQSLDTEFTNTASQSDQLFFPKREPHQETVWGIW